MMWCRIFGHKYTKSGIGRWVDKKYQLRYKCKRCGGVKYE